MECCVGADNKGNGIHGVPLGVIIQPGVVVFERSSEGGGEEEQSEGIAWHGGHGETERGEQIQPKNTLKN